jgi:hypothetical protein
MTFSSSTSVPATPAGGSTYSCDVDTILGVALFDNDGLPQEYFITSTHRDTTWIQIVFQSLGLQSLLTASFRFAPLQHAVARTQAGDAVVIHHSQGFLSLLVQRTQVGIPVQVNEPWIEWALTFAAEQLRTHPRFKAL